MLRSIQKLIGDKRKQLITSVLLFSKGKELLC